RALVESKVPWRHPPAVGITGLARVGGIEGRLESVPIEGRQLRLVDAEVDSLQDDFRGERQRGDDCPGRKGAVVWPVGHAACDIVVEFPQYATHLESDGARSLACRDPPAMLGIARELAWVFDRVALLDVGCPAAVHEIVDSL